MYMYRDVCHVLFHLYRIYYCYIHLILEADAKMEEHLTEGNAYNKCYYR